MMVRQPLPLITRLSGQDWSANQEHESKPNGSIQVMSPKRDEYRFSPVC
jgi:hypothetical protein